MACVVYWLYDHSCFDPRTDGYVGVTGQHSPKRFSQHRHTEGIYRRLPKKFDTLILFRGSFKECDLIETALRPATFIGWNILAGGSKALKLYGIHNFRYGRPLSEREKQKIRIKIDERGGIVNPIPKGSRLSDAERASIKAGTNAHIRPLTREQQQRHLANTQRGESHHAFGKPMKITNPALGKNQSGARNPFFGKRHSTDTKQKQRLAKLGANNPNWKSHNKGQLDFNF